MRLKVSLRARFISALLVIMVLLATGFAFAVFWLIEGVEQELGHNVLKHELAEFAQTYREQPERALDSEPGLLTFIVSPDQVSELPPALAVLAANTSEEVHIDGIDYLAGRTDVGATRLYLAMNNEHLEMVEKQLFMLAILLIVAAFAIAIGAGYALSHLVTGPVTGLANLVSRLDPARRGVRLGGSFGDQDVNRIAGAFDAYLERLDRFVAREQTFTDDASHELRTPLSVITSAADLLREDPALPPVCRKRLDRISRASQRMNGIIEALLFLARDEAVDEIESCELSEIVHDVTEGLREAAAAKGLSLHDETPVPMTVTAPPAMAHMVISNLVENAVAHTEHGRIDVRLEPGRLIIQDTGPGIEPEDIQHLFERGFRGAQSRGRGLGLYLVQRITERLDWKISVQSTPGTGTCFEVMFNNRH
jgi:signal transduction histidine kinase